MSEAKKFSDLAAISELAGAKLIGLANDNAVGNVNIGELDNMIPHIIHLGSSEKMIQQGYMKQSELNDTESYLRACLKKLEADYPLGGLFFGIANPNNQGFVIIYKVKTNSLNPNVNGLPKYSCGIYVTYELRIVVFRTYNGAFSTTIS